MSLLRSTCKYRAELPNPSRKAEHLDAIGKGISRPSEIARYIPDASTRVIEMQLAELLFYGIVSKCAEDVYPIIIIS